MELKPGEHFAHYNIVSLLGAGGMGVVFRAHDARLGRDVAIKTLPKDGALDPVRLQRFEQEAQAASALNHPNVVSVFDVGSEAGVPYLVTELLEGQSLRDRLKTGRIPVRKAIDIALQIANGLAAVHDRNIVHRDLKPDNVFLTSDGRVKILDFGVSRCTEPLTPSTGTLPLTQSGAVLGTAGYMSPEQVRGQAADARSDIFALGSILYEMVTGAMAFPGETPVERGYAILNSDPPEPEFTNGGIPPALLRIIRRCLEKSPHERFQMARDVAFALEAVTDGSGSTPKFPREALGHSTSPWKRWLGVGALVALSLGVGAVISRAVAPQEQKQEPAAVTLFTPPPKPPPVFKRVSFRHGYINNARFSRGGGLVYSGAFEGEPVRLFAGNLNSANTRPVADPYTSLYDISSTDELAFVTVPLKPEAGPVLSRLDLSGGAPRAMYENVVDADYSSDGKTLLLVRTDRKQFTIEYPPGNVVLTSPDTLRAARLSPDDRYIAFQRQPVANDDRGHVEVIDLAGKLVARSKDVWTLEGLAWNPKTKEVWFTAGEATSDRSIRALSLNGEERSVLNAPGSLVLFDIDEDGRALFTSILVRSRMLGHVPGMEGEGSVGWLDGSQPADLSADGQAVLFIEGRGTEVPEIQTYLRTFDGSAPVPIAQGWGRALSPDKSWAIVSPNAPFNTLTLVPTGPGQHRDLPPGDFVSIRLVRFFPDGKRILIGAVGQDRRPHLYVQPVDGSAPPTRVSDEEVEIFGPPSPDGTVAMARTRELNVVEVNLQTGAVRPMEGLKQGDVPLNWSKDGKAVILARFPTPRDRFRYQLVRFDRATKKERVLSEAGPRDPAGVTGVRSGVTTPDGTYYVYVVQQNITELYVAEGL